MSSPVVYNIEVLEHFDEQCVGSIQLEGIGTFWSIRTSLVKKSFLIILILSFTILNQNCPNTPKCPDIPQSYTTVVCTKNVYKVEYEC